MKSGMIKISTGKLNIYSNGIPSDHLKNTQMKILVLIFLLTFAPLLFFAQQTKPSSSSASSGFIIFNIGPAYKSQANDKKPPLIVITSIDSTRGFKPIVSDKEYFIRGRVYDDSGILEVLVNGQDAYLDADGNFSSSILLAMGTNKIIVEATDIRKNYAQKEFIVERISAQQARINIQPNLSTNDEISEGRYYALIIANQEYTDNGFITLNNPVNDAEKLYQVLTTEYIFDAENIVFLKNANYLQMIHAFDELSNKITANDNLLIFYAGHGYWDEVKKLGYWLPVDAQKNGTAYWIPNSRICDYLKATNSRHTLLIADACFSGSIFKTRLASDNAPAGIQRLYELPSRKAMTSGYLKTVPDESVFIQYLTKRLDENKEKYLSADMLFSSFRQAVLNNSQTEPQYGTIQNTGDEGGEFIFIRR